MDKIFHFKLSNELLLQFDKAISYYDKNENLIYDHICNERRDFIELSFSTIEEMNREEGEFQLDCDKKTLHPIINWDSKANLIRNQLFSILNKVVMSR